MCGIAGFIGDFESSLLLEMSSRIAHRGPDDIGEIVLTSVGRTRRVGLSHRRLSIIDLSANGHQPMAVRCDKCGVSDDSPNDRRIWLVYNGELYNFRELKQELQSRGHTFSSRSDSEVLIHLYSEYGPAMLERLNGIFAFALYDGRLVGQTSETRPGDVFLARDGLGVKPLYFAEVNQGFLFSSELKALLAWDGLLREIDFTAIHHYLAYLWAPAPRTPFRSVNKFAPGEAMIVRDGRVAKRWTFYDQPYRGERLGDSYDDVAKKLETAFAAAVKRQLIADVPVGAFLSGGLDSSAIAAMMRDIQPGASIPCYCIGFGDKGDLDGHTPDLPFASKVAKHLDLDLRVIEIGPEIISHLEELIYYLDEPQGDPAPINALLIARQARKDGIKVLMSGAGGDDIFAGYRRHISLRLEPLWKWAPLWTRAIIARPARAALNGRSPFTTMADVRVRAVAKVLAYSDLSDEDRLISYYLWSGEQLRRSLYASEVAQELSKVDTAEPLFRSLDRIPLERDPLNRMLYLDVRHFLADHNLNYIDKTSMSAGVEARVPLLDPDLVALATKIPVDMKLRGRKTKAVFKKAMEPWVPREVVYRPKTGFGAPLRRWLKKELRETIEEVLSPSSLRNRGLFEPRAVRNLIDLDRAGKIDGSYTVFSLLCIELWCRIFKDKSGIAPAG